MSDQAQEDTNSPVGQVEIAQIETETLIVPIRGTMPLIVHKFSEKAKRIMLGGMRGEKKVKTIKDPQAEYEASLYRMKNDRYGFPVTAFKAATISAARFYGKDVSMVALRQLMYMHGEVSDLDPQALVEIHGTPRMREDTVRLNASSTDLRYRAEFPEWWVELRVTYIQSSLSRDSLLSLIDAGGYIGVGEWRPVGKKSTGDFGTYRIDTTKDIEVVKE